MLKMLLTKSVMACSVCYGSADSPMTIGLNYGILSMLAIVGTVLGLLGFFFLNVRNRMRRLVSN